MWERGFGAFHKSKRGWINYTEQKNLRLTSWGNGLGLDPGTVFRSTSSSGFGLTGCGP